MRISDWSSDVCSSDLINVARRLAIGRAHCIAERLRLEPPIFLERSSAGAYFRSSEIKACAAARSRMRHEREIHHVVSAERSEERRVGKAVSVRVDLGGRRSIKKKIKKK